MSTDRVQRLYGIAAGLFIGQPHLTQDRGHVVPSMSRKPSVGFYHSSKNAPLSGKIIKLIILAPSHFVLKEYFSNLRGSTHTSIPTRL